MDNAQVRHKIETLIDSVNWESLEPDRRNKPSEIRDILLGKAHTSIWRRCNHPNASYIIAYLLLHILDHPEWHMDKIVFDQLTRLPMLLEWAWTRGRQPERQRVHRRLHQAFLQLIPYLNHRNADYRAYTALALSSDMYRPNEMISHLLAQLQHERSPRVIYHILYALLHPFSFRRQGHITLETRAAVLQQANRLLYAKQPLIRHVAATLMMRMLGRKTPDSVIDMLVSTWPHLRKTEWHTYGVMDEPFTGHINSLGPQRAFDLSVRLMSSSPTYSAICIVWDTFFHGSLRHWLGWHEVSGQRIALTSKQKLVMETVLACRSLWMLKRSPRYRLEMQGFQEVRAQLRHQIKHAQIVDTIDDGPNWRQFPLRIKPELRRSKD